MWQASRIAVIVPAFQEERLVGRTLRRIPDYVDALYVVDDGSTDRTWEVIHHVLDSRLRPLRHPRNRGVGAAIVTGYRAAIADGVDVMAVMAGDDQMHPEDLERLIAPVALGQADYVKGNRFLHPDFRRMPWPRRAAGHGLSRLTRLSTGLSVDDTQCGFTALGLGMARRLPLDQLWPGYGYPNDLLGMLARAGAAVVEVPVRPVYADERSGVRPWHAAIICGVLARRWALDRLGQPRAGGSSR
jgi:glycosyltransferase involved in cell wall biosynthesis